MNTNEEKGYETVLALLAAWKDSDKETEGSRAVYDSILCILDLIARPPIVPPVPFSPEDQKLLDSIF